MHGGPVFSGERDSQNARHRLDAQGFVAVEAVLSPAACTDLLRQLAPLAGHSVGTRRLLAQPWCAELSRTIRSHPVMAALIPADHVAVQCTYFEKSTAQNWRVPVHQDLSIPVAQRVDHALLTGWSVKEGELYVQAPESVLAALVAVRLHVDACTEADGPLRVLPGSHRLGATSPEEAARLRRAGEDVACTLAPGGVLVMRPLLLHASSKATGTSQRRVLHFLYGPPALPLGLQWPLAVAA